jgi:C-methyltransferase C-terminal domain/Putative zinc binding domain/Methyltransferase domain
MHLVHRKTCRVCGSTALTPVISLGEQHLQGSFVKPGKELPPLRTIECSLVRCDPTRDEKACGLLQMVHSVPPEILYSAYWYRSGTNRTMTEHLQGIVREATAMVRKPDARVLDIGCNDCTLLNAYPEGFTRFGIDPSDVGSEPRPGLNVINDLFPSEELKQRLGSRKLDIITSIAMFYDLEDPVAFVHAVADLLDPQGIWIVEMSYMPSMLELNSYDTICHEHLEYYSLAVLERVFATGGMKVVRVEENACNGGSIRCYVTHSGNFRFKQEGWTRSIKAMRQKEFDLALDTDAPYLKFQSRIDGHKKVLSDLLHRLKAEGKRVHIYGASTKGNTILQWCGIDKNLIDMASERNPDKFGARTLGTDIPIVSEAESRAARPDFYLVLPWHFRDEFLEREKALLEAGTGMIFPLPEVEVFQKEGLKRTSLPQARP